MTTRDVLTKGRGLNRRPLPLEPIPAQDWLAQSKFAELDEHNSAKPSHSTDTDRVLFIFPSPFPWPLRLRMRSG